MALITVKGSSQSTTPAGITSSTGSPTTVNNLWAGSQAQYDAIVTKDPNTIYFIS